MNEIINTVIEYVQNIALLEFLGLVFGLLAVYFLIVENIWTWPTGLTYVFISFVIFWKAKLYADFGLHIVFLILNVYGWYYWVYGKKQNEVELPVTLTSRKLLIALSLISFIGIFLMGALLNTYTDASLPYWDSATTMLSFVGMWLTARKKLENWHFWFVVDVLATGIYIYKGIYFYAILYLIYVGMAVSGYLIWKKSMSIPAT